MNILQDKKKLGIAIGAGVAVVAIIIGIASVSMRGKKKLDNSPKVTVETSEGSTDLDKKTANGLGNEETVEGESGSDLETEPFEKIDLSDGQGYAYPNGDAETVADNSPEEKQEETADVNEFNDPNLDEVNEEEGDGFEYEVDPEMEKQDAEAEKQVSSNLGGSGEGLTGDAATDYIFNELSERDRVQEEMAARSGIGQ